MQRVGSGNGRLGSWYPYLVSLDVVSQLSVLLKFLILSRMKFSHISKLFYVIRPRLSQCLHKEYPIHCFFYIAQGHTLENFDPMKINVKYLFFCTRVTRPFFVNWKPNGYFNNYSII